jgi:hypothetical protein
MTRCFHFIVSIIVLTMLQTPSFHQIKGSDFQVMELYSSPHNCKATEGKETSSLTASSIYPLRTSLKSGGNSEIYEPKLRSQAKESSQTSRSHSPLTSHRISGLSVKQKSLIRLVKRSDYSSLKRLAHKISPAEANTRDEQGNPLLYAAAQSSLKVTALLLALGAKVDATGEGGNTPLHAAFAADREDTILHLVRCGANLEKKNKGKLEPLAVASDRIRGTLGWKQEDSSANVSARDLIQRLQPKPSRSPLRPNFTLHRRQVAPSKPRISANRPSSTQPQPSKTPLRSNSPLYPSPMRSGLHFQGEPL